MPDELPWQIREFVPEDEQVHYADEAVIQRPWTKVRYHGWVALTDRAFHFRGRTIRKEWVFPPTPTRWTEKHVPYGDFEEIDRGDVSKAEIRIRGDRFYLELRRKDDEKTAHWNRRQMRFVSRLRDRCPEARRGDKERNYPFFRKVEMPPHDAMNPRQAVDAIRKGGSKAQRHGMIWDEEE